MLFIFYLQGVDELGVKVRCDFNIYIVCKKLNVYYLEVVFFVLWYFVFIDELGDNGVGSIIKILLWQVDYGDNRV